MLDYSRQSWSSRAEYIFAWKAAGFEIEPQGLSDFGKGKPLPRRLQQLSPVWLGEIEITLQKLRKKQKSHASRVPLLQGDGKKKWHNSRKFAANVGYTKTARKVLPNDVVNNCMASPSQPILRVTVQDRFIELMFHPDFLNIFIFSVILKLLS